MLDMIPDVEFARVPNPRVPSPARSQATFHVRKFQTAILHLLVDDVFLQTKIIRTCSRFTKELDGRFYYAHTYQYFASKFSNIALAFDLQ